MFESPYLEIWNLTHDGTARVGSQSTFNVVGRVFSPESVESLSYSLNGGAERPVFFFDPAHYSRERLWNPGDFNIDTISLSELNPENRLDLRVKRRDGAVAVASVSFRLAPFEAGDPRFELDPEAVTAAEQVGQVVDGRWTIGRDEAGEACIELRPEDAGYDRILLFGRLDWTTGYEVRARLAPTAWTSTSHNLGLLFKWNPHLQGDGLHLPTQWSTGLGYYCSYTPGLRIRFGVDVHIDETGKKLGDFVLRDAMFSPWRRLARKLLNQKLNIFRPISQLETGTQFHFRLRVDPRCYSLAVWRDGRSEPAPQVVVLEPQEKLAQGCVGLIALCCSVRLYEFRVSPIESSSRSRE